MKKKLNRFVTQINKTILKLQEQFLDENFDLNVKFLYYFHYYL